MGTSSNPKRQQAQKLLASGLAIREVARQLAMPEKSIRRWMAQPEWGVPIQLAREVRSLTADMTARHDDDGRDDDPPTLDLAGPLGTSLDELERLIPRLQSAADREDKPGACYQALIRAHELRAELRSERKVPASLEAAVSRECARYRKALCEMVLQVAGEATLRKVLRRLDGEET